LQRARDHLHPLLLAAREGLRPGSVSQLEDTNEEPSPSWYPERAMYAVINAGGKQARVEVGEKVDVELLRSEPGDEVSLTPLLLVDGDSVVADSEGLASAVVTATVVGPSKGPKITGFTYKPKTRQSRRYGHRQHYTTLQITGIDAAGATK
jgi:large subunit ribosomal protein L21